MGRIGVGTVLLAALLTVFSLPAAAQVFTGRIDVTVLDNTGAVLPGATVEISGVQAGSAVSDAQGEAHFLNLAPGRYAVTVKLSRFGDYKNDNVSVGAGLSVPLRVSMTLGGVATDVTVTATTPQVDAKKTTVSTNVSIDELQNLPSSRDPWVVLQTVPGVIVDRVNVGGAESGQQSNFRGKGASGGDNTWNLDGIPITDMGALGSSPTYYDFDMFQEIQIGTGGADVASPTPGISVNFILRSGTNVWKGSGRYYYESGSWQSDNVPQDALGQVASYNRMDSYKDYGFEAGGAVAKDRLWVWGSYGKTHPRLDIYTRCSSTAPVPSGCAVFDATHYGVSAHDETILEDYSFKGTGEINDSTRASFTYFRGNKEKFGRGASATHPDETTWNQTGPTQMYKVEVNKTLSSTLFMSARYAHIMSGFSLTPRGGTNVAYRDDSLVWHGNYQKYSTDRPQDTFQADGNKFKGEHELKFGFSYRHTPVTSESSWPGGNGYTYYTGYPSMQVVYQRPFVGNGTTNYTSLYASDTFTRKRFTFNLGVRFDRQAGSAGAVTQPANPSIPNILPSIDAPAASNAVVWTSFTPRVGVTYALDADRKTILRASYAMFASQLAASGNSPPSATVVSASQYSYAQYSAVDKNGNGYADLNEVDFNDGYVVAPTNVNKVGDYTVPRTNEFIVGFDRQLMRDTAIGASFTWRSMGNFDWYHPTGVTGSDYTQAGTYTCTAAEQAIVGPCSVPYYRVNSAAIPADGSYTFESRPGYHQKFWGLELYANKRLSRNWQGRLGFSTSDHRERFDNADARFNPTNVLPSSSTVATAPLRSPNFDDGAVLVPTGGSGKSNIYMVLPRYQFIMNSSYQFKYDINVAMNYVLRQGYATPYFRSAVPGDALGGSQNLLLVGSSDAIRLPGVHSLDLRIGKTVKVKKFTFNVDGDIFNLFNTATVLGRQYDLRAATANQILEIQNPRIFRIGFRIGY